MNLSITSNDTIERIIKNARPNYIDNLSQLKKEVIDSELDNLEKKKLVQNIDFAIERIKAPLEISLRIKYLIFPFGIISYYTDPEKTDYEKFDEFGYIRKEKESILLSVIGFFIYIAIGFIAAQYF